MKIYEINPLIIVLIIMGIIALIGLIFYYFAIKKEEKEKTVYDELKAELDRLKSD